MFVRAFVEPALDRTGKDMGGKCDGLQMYTGRGHTRANLCAPSCSRLGFVMLSGARMAGSWAVAT